MSRPGPVPVTVLPAETQAMVEALRRRVGCEHLQVGSARALRGTPRDHCGCQALSVALSSVLYVGNDVEQADHIRFAHGQSARYDGARRLDRGIQAR